MKIRYIDLYNMIANESELRNLKLPIKQSLTIAKALHEARGALLVFEDVKNKLLSDHGYVDVSTLPESEREEQRRKNEALLPELNKKLNELLSEEVEINVKPIKIDEIDNLQELPVNVTESILWLFEV